MRISINSERLDNVLVVALDGRVDSANANEFQKMMEAEIVPEDKALIMDFEKVSFISSAGLRVIVIIAKRFKGPYKKFGVCALSEPVNKLFSISGLDRTMTVHGSQTEAIAAFKDDNAQERRVENDAIKVKEAVDFGIVGDNMEDILISL